MTGPLCCQVVTAVPHWDNMGLLSALPVGMAKGALVSDAIGLGHDDVELPEVIVRYQEAHDRHDTEAALSAFARNARVVDENREYRGEAEIGHWLRTAAVEFTYTRTLLSADCSAPDTWLVLNHLEGNFPGGEVDLRYKFVLAADLIIELIIAP